MDSSQLGEVAEAGVTPVGGQAARKKVGGEVQVQQGGRGIPKAHRHRTFQAIMAELQLL